MRLRKLFEFVGDHFGIAVEVITTDGRQPIGWGIGPVLEAQDVMAVLANDPSAPSDLREKSLRLAAHVLENDPDLRGGTRICASARTARKRRRAQANAKDHRRSGPFTCRTDLGTLNADIARPDDGVVSGIDCLRLNRLARMAGAPIDKGAGIRILKKIGDHVEKGEPIYRIHAFEPSEFELAVGCCQTDAGYHVDGSRSPTGEPRHERHRHPLSAVGVAPMPRRLAACLAVPVHEISIHTFPDGELRVTSRAGFGRQHCLCPTRPPERQTPGPAVRRGSASARMAASGSFLSRPTSATCGRTLLFIPARRSAKRSIGQLIASSFDRVDHRRRPPSSHRPTSSDVFPGIDADNLSAMPAIASILRKTAFDPRNRSLSVPMPNRARG